MTLSPLLLLLLDGSLFKLCVVFLTLFQYRASENLRVIIFVIRGIFQISQSDYGYPSLGVSCVCVFV